MIAYIDIDLKSITKTKNNTVAYENGSGGSEVGTAFIEAYNDDINEMNRYKNWFVGINTTLQNKVNEYKQQSQNVTGKNISRSEFATSLEKIKGDTTWESASKNIDTSFNNYKNYREETDNEYDQAFAMIQGYLDSSSTPTYTPRPIPVISVPKIQQTYCSNYGNSISCNSISY